MYRHLRPRWMPERALFRRSWLCFRANDRLARAAAPALRDRLGGGASSGSPYTLSDTPRPSRTHFPLSLVSQ